MKNVKLERSKPSTHRGRESRGWEPGDALGGAAESAPGCGPVPPRPAPATHEGQLAPLHGPELREVLLQLLCGETARLVHGPQSPRDRRRSQAPTPAHGQCGEVLRGALTARHRPGHIGHEDVEAAPCPPRRPHRAGRRHLVPLLRPPPARPGCAPRPLAAPGPKWRRRRRWAGRAGRTHSDGSFASTGGETPPSCAACSISPRRGDR